MAATCHYCRKRQPARRLRPLELSTAGPVSVCRDADDCRKRAQRELLVPARAHKADAPPPRRFMNKSMKRWSIGIAVFVVGLFVLPHIGINGHHYRIWWLP